MNCRNCGAAKQPVGARAYFRCEHCGTFGFPSTIGDGIAVLDRDGHLPCPVCRATLGVGTIQGISVQYCDECRGFLTTNAEFGAIVQNRRNDSDAGSGITPAFDRAELRRRLRCPACERSMETHPYGGGGNAVVDTCHRCHLIWLDAGELDVIGRYRPATGVRFAAPVSSSSDS